MVTKQNSHKNPKQLGLESFWVREPIKVLEGGVPGKSTPFPALCPTYFSLLAVLDVYPI